MPLINNVRYNNKHNTAVRCDFDGKDLKVSADMGNRHYAEIVEQGIEIAPYVEPEPSWEDNRIAAYGSVGSQLDMQYWDGVNSTTVWADHIAKVKTDFPKPG